MAGHLAERLSLIEQDRPGHDYRRARAVAALREAAQLLGHSPSIREYRELRQAHPEYRWPPDGSVRRWMSASASWNAALAEARLDAVPDPQPRTVEQGPNLTDEEILMAVLECASDLDKPVAELTFSRYRSWSRDPVVRRRPGRRPQSQVPFDRLGGWREVKRRAIGGDPAEAERAIAAAGADGHGYRYTDREIFAAAEEIIERLPEGVWPTIAEWIRERSELLAEERRRGMPPRAFPGHRVVGVRFGNWAKARHAYEKARKR